MGIGMNKKIDKSYIVNKYRVLVVAKVVAATHESSLQILDVREVKKRSMKIETMTKKALSIKKKSMVLFVL